MDKYNAAIGDDYVAQIDCFGRRKLFCFVSGVARVPCARGQKIALTNKNCRV